MYLLSCILKNSFYGNDYLVSDTTIQESCYLGFTAANSP